MPSFQIRPMTADEKDLFYVDGTLPCGHGNAYIPGPEGGMMMNIRCASCSLKLNVVNPDVPGLPRTTDLPGEVLNEPEGYDLLLKDAMSQRPSVVTRVLRKLAHRLTLA